MNLIDKTSTSISVATATAEGVEEKPKAPTERGMPWFFPVLVFGGVALLLLVYLGQFASLVRTQYRIVAMRDRQRTLEREKIDLQLQIQGLTSLERVERIATGRLKMIPPPRRQVLDLTPGATHRVAEVSGKNSTQAQ